LPLEPREVLASTKASVPPKFEGWIDFNLNVKLEPKHLYQINLYGKPGLFWFMSKPLPGVAAAYKRPHWKRWTSTFEA